MVIKQVSKWYLLFQYNKTENNKIEFDKLINEKIGGIEMFTEE